MINLFIRNLISAIVIFNFCFSCLAQIKDPIVIGAYPKPGLIQEDEKGLFNKLNKHVFSYINHPMQLSIKPIRRIKKSFQREV